MNDTIAQLYEIIARRKKEPYEGSYTCYLFEQGIDKILKKCAEECGETIIAAKNGDNEQTSEEICDLIYHLLVLMVAQDIPLGQVTELLEQRSLKLGNLKQMKRTDRVT